jgi:intracellular multiplication protein IcmK
VAQNFVSSVIFLDSTGAPWPLVGYDLGDPGAFSIQWDKKSNLLMIQSKKMYTYGNIAIKLAGLNTPVMLTLVPGQKAIDYRIDMRVQGFGPNAKDLPTGLGLPASADNVLLSVLEGIAPNGSTELTVKGGPASAWKLGDKLYVRTGLKILSPGWLATMNSGDGTNAYEMQIAPVLLVSWHGRVMQLQIEGL